MTSVRSPLRDIYTELDVSFVSIIINNREWRQFYLHQSQTEHDINLVSINIFCYGVWRQFRLHPTPGVLWRQFRLHPTPGVLWRQFRRLRDNIHWHSICMIDPSIFFFCLHRQRTTVPFLSITNTYRSLGVHSSTPVTPFHSTPHQEGWSETAHTSNTRVHTALTTRWWDNTADAGKRSPASKGGKGLF